MLVLEIEKIIIPNCYKFGMNSGGDIAFLVPKYPDNITVILNKYAPMIESIVLPDKEEIKLPLYSHPS